MYLNRYKAHLPVLYKWNANIDRLVELETLTENQIAELNALTPYEKELRLKLIVRLKLNEAMKSDLPLFNKLCLWIIKDWGGIKTTDDDATIKAVRNF